MSGTLFEAPPSYLAGTRVLFIDEEIYAFSRRFPRAVEELGAVATKIDDAALVLTEEKICKVVRQERPDLVVLDIMLPVDQAAKAEAGLGSVEDRKLGYEIHRTLRRVLKNLRVVILSAAPIHEVHENIKKNKGGFDEVVSKDDDEEKFIETASKLLKRNQWVCNAFDELREIQQFESTWDPSSGEKTTDRAGKNAEAILREIAEHCSRKPTVVPTLLGGVQLDWNSGESGVEIEILPQNGVSPDGDPYNVVIFLEVNGEQIFERWLMRTAIDYGEVTDAIDKVFRS